MMPTCEMIDPQLSGLSPEEIANILLDNYSLLDTANSRPLGGRLVGWDLYEGNAYIPDMQLVRLPNIFVGCRYVPVLSDLLKALWLLGSAQAKDCILIDGGTRLGILSCILNSFLLRHKRNVVLYEAYMPDNRSWREQYSSWLNKIRHWAARRMILGTTLTVVWSRQQLIRQADFLNVPTTKFVFMPFKSNHSKAPPIKMKTASYVFSGGNSRRDYATLFEAVRGTDIPVIVSSTDQAVYASLDVPENVVLLAAREPAFARLMALSRFVVLSIRGQLIKGAGESTICDAMWHGRAVICADDSTASGYIEDGITGYVTPPGDVKKMRERILTLWHQPEKAEEMGKAAHQAVLDSFMHDRFQQRLRELGAIVTTIKY